MQRTKGKARCKDLLGILAERKWRKACKQRDKQTAYDVSKQDEQEFTDSTEPT